MGKTDRFPRLLGQKVHHRFQDGDKTAKRRPPRRILEMYMSMYMANADAYDIVQITIVTRVLALSAVAQMESVKHPGKNGKGKTLIVLLS